MIKNFFKIIINAITLVLIMLICVIIIGKVEKAFTGKSYATFFGYTSFQIASGSMEPTLSVDDVILVDTKSSDYKVDDIISYESDDTIITHRIIEITGKRIIVKGDSNNSIDKPITEDMIIGKVIKVFPKLKIWKDIITSPKIIILIFVTLLLFDFALSYKQPEKVKVEKINKVTEEKNVSKKPETKKALKDNEIKIEVKKNIIEKEDLMDLTRKIDISEITEIINEVSSKEEQQKEKENEYTIRLDLRKLQEEINKSVDEKEEKILKQRKKTNKKPVKKSVINESKKQSKKAPVKKEVTKKETTKKQVKKKDTKKEQNKSNNKKNKK